MPGIAIGGVVKDESGAPIAGARVEVLRPAERDGGIELRLHRRRGHDRRHGPMAGRPRTRQPGRRERPDPGTAVPRDRRAAAAQPRRRDHPEAGLDDQGPRARCPAPADRRREQSGCEWIEPMTTKTDAGGAFVLENCKPGRVGRHGAGRGLRARPAGGPPRGPARAGIPPRAGAHDARPGRRPERQARGGRDHLSRYLAGPPLPSSSGRHRPGRPVRMARARRATPSFSASPRPATSPAGDVALPPTGAIQVITLDPELVISGRVTDAATGRPVPAFRLIRGLVFSNNPRAAVEGITANLTALIRGIVSEQPAAALDVQEAAAFTGGYTTKFDGAYAGYAVRVEADGYKPTDSRIFRPGEVCADVRLRPDPHRGRRPPHGCRPPPRRPARGRGPVALATPEHPLVFETELTAFSRGNGMSIAKTGPDGRFSFDKPGGAYLLAAMSDDGYAEATPEGRGKPGRACAETLGQDQGPGADRPSTGRGPDHRLGPPRRSPRRARRGERILPASRRGPTPRATSASTG